LTITLKRDVASLLRSSARAFGFAGQFGERDRAASTFADAARKAFNRTADETDVEAMAPM
jgi:hypothetical protein